MHSHKLKILYSTNIFKNFLIFITTCLFVINSGFYIKEHFLICPIYLSFYLALIVLTFSLLFTKKIKILFSCILCIITIIYQFSTQICCEIRIWSLLASISTISFYLIGLFLFKQLNKRQIFTISNIFLAYNLILYSVDTIYRFSLFNFNLKNIFINFYIMKDSCLIFGDTNMVAINTTILTFFAYYLYKLTNNEKYQYYIYLFTILTFFTFSRASILAILLSSIIFLLFKHLKTIFRDKLQLFPKIPLKTFISYTISFAIIVSLIPLGIILVSFLMNDGSFLTKIDIFNEILAFFDKATPIQMLFGIGFDNSETFVGMYAHNYLATYIIETGIIGYIIITSFLLRILYETPKSIYILLPFSIFGISFIGYTMLNLFYITLALIATIEHKKVGYNHE